MVFNFSGKDIDAVRDITPMPSEGSTSENAGHYWAAHRAGGANGNARRPSTRHSRGRQNEKRSVHRQAFDDDKVIETRRRALAVRCFKTTR